MNNRPIAPGDRVRLKTGSGPGTVTGYTQLEGEDALFVVWPEIERVCLESELERIYADTMTAEDANALWNISRAWYVASEKPSVRTGVYGLSEEECAAVNKIREEDEAKQRAALWAKIIEIVDGNR